MNLNDLAAQDARLFVENAESGFGVRVTVTSPEGLERELSGIVNDVSQTLDPQTGILVSSRVVSVVLSRRAFSEAGWELPHGVAENSERPWLVSWSDLDGARQVFKVSETRPDLRLGLVVCLLEGYEL